MLFQGAAAAVSGVADLRTSDDVKVGYDLPDCLHLQIDDAIELLPATLLAPDFAETTFSPGKSEFAQCEWQFDYLDADALCRRPAVL
jgi:hypothetical protein